MLQTIHIITERRDIGLSERGKESKFCEQELKLTPWGRKMKQNKNERWTVE